MDLQVVVLLLIYLRPHKYGDTSLLLLVRGLMDSVLPILSTCITSAFLLSFFHVRPTKINIHQVSVRSFLETEIPGSITDGNPQSQH